MTLPITTIATVLKQQYHAVLATAREPIERCPADLWTSAGENFNPFWRVAYHTLFFAHLYLQKDEASFVPWEKHKQHRGGFDPLPEDDAQPYSKADLLEYWQQIDDRAEGWVDEMDLTSETCGFSWYKLGKFEHQLVNLRHIQHHAAQMADRLRAATGDKADWYSSGRAEA